MGINESKQASTANQVKYASYLDQRRSWSRNRPLVCCCYNRETTKRKYRYIFRGCIVA